MKTRVWFPVVSVLWIAASALNAIAQTPPPAPVPVAPANGASLVQPITLQWQPIVDPDGPIGSYSWEVGTSSTFGTVIAAGFNNFDGDVPLPTTAQVSGLANGTYFWRVRGAQDLGAAGFIDSLWSAPRSFTVTGLGPAPAVAPIITSPAMASSFHPFEFFDITWTEVPGAQYYLLEADEDAGFAHPINLGTSMEFGTKFQVGWGNELTVHYRVRAVSFDNVWGRPSATLTVHITNPLSVSAGADAAVSHQHHDYAAVQVRLDRYRQSADQRLRHRHRRRAEFPGRRRRPDGDADQPLRLHGRAGPARRGDQSVCLPAITSGASARCTGTSSGRGHRDGHSPSPPCPRRRLGLDLFWILTDPGTVEGGNSTAARIALNMPAPAGGATVHLASDFPGVEIPPSVHIPAGSTDAVVSPVTTTPVSGSSLGTLRAAYGLFWQQNSIGSWPILWGGTISPERAVAGSTVTGS